MSKTHILFICTGNTCRSPLAEILLKEKAGSQFDVQSAGIYAFPGSPASAGTTEVLEKRNLKADEHLSQALTLDLVDWADVVLTMTESHRQQLISQYPEHEIKTYSLTSFVEEVGDISDPFGGPVEVYEQTAQQLEYLLHKLIKKLT
ncbi:protein tyrosine phosphatase [Alkalihalobacillus alcalophilus ATCC 27647 = CGMCC 1.3604]|uniref:Phosphatase n=1 Tax=Alkalihalobacillus alcalophilus ATCC 27647 = CGMCC 1.3604 TaxID=1218173 RepID=A0A094WM50_ALKAL|nr:low molecular weight protein arginine phosphatase [Alkalihalobacillus alcalophilus]KGA97043.1 phosphatase [Alkalihalobacillus alcalophilus ATCC 27647 = CGMCC 1.3604]MED1561122.1 low molecular weight protein arginine phosphatase [Alkalihalobacillus alcalophilus]THG89795.1 protein tyrosine phosphatase [Alkalihalobacillus alcalophilus ATCC 27647 = CGMCC 1.3604]